MTGSEFLAYVKKVFIRPDKDSEIYEATTDTIADIRLQLKAEDYKEEAYIAGITTLGDYRITLPTDFGHIIGDVTLVDNDSAYTRTLKKISKQDYDTKYGDRLYTTTSNIEDGVPCEFCIYGNQLFIGPVPDETSYRYYINYTTEAYTEVSATTDPVPFANKYRVMLRAGVLAEVYAGLEFFDEANFWRQSYMDGLTKLKRSQDENIADNNSVAYSGV